MKAADALEILVDPAKIITTRITFPEGLRVVDIVELLVEKTDFSRAQFEKVLDDPASSACPTTPSGNPEGYLFPSTYGFGPTRPRPACCGDGRPVEAGRRGRRPRGRGGASSATRRTS